jgi:hypothetical protein
MKAMIIIQGVSDTGKTETIKKAFDLFCEMKVSDKSLGIKLLNFRPHGNADGEKYDICAMLKYKGRKIGLASMGDPDSDQAGALEELGEAKCDIILGASHSSGVTNDNVKYYADNYGYHLVKITNRIDHTKDDLNYDLSYEAWNAYFAKGIIKLIDELVEVMDLTESNESV